MFGFSPISKDANRAEKAVAIYLERLRFTTSKIKFLVDEFNKGFKSGWGQAKEDADKEITAGILDQISGKSLVNVVEQEIKTNPKQIGVVIGGLVCALRYAPLHPLTRENIKNSYIVLIAEIAKKTTRAKNYIREVAEEMIGKSHKTTVDLNEAKSFEYSKFLEEVISLTR